jgi:hypothetical protein
MPKRRRSGERQRSAKGSAFSRTDSSLEQLDEIPSSLHSALMGIRNIEGTLRQTRLTNESAEYRPRREELRLAEIDLMQRRERVAELLTPVYNLLDLTPEGRGDWYAKLTYPEGPHWALR